MHNVFFAGSNTLIPQTQVMPQLPSNEVPSLVNPERWLLSHSEPARALPPSPCFTLVESITFFHQTLSHLSSEEMFCSSLFSLPIFPQRHAQNRFLTQARGFVDPPTYANPGTGLSPGLWAALTVFISVLTTDTEERFPLLGNMTRISRTRSVLESWKHKAWYLLIRAKIYRFIGNGKQLAPLDCIKLYIYI